MARWLPREKCLKEAWEQWSSSYQEWQEQKLKTPIKMKRCSSLETCRRVLLQEKWEFAKTYKNYQSHHPSSNSLSQQQWLQEAIINQRALSISQNLQIIKAHKIFKLETILLFVLHSIYRINTQWRKSRLLQQLNQ